MLLFIKEDARRRKEDDFVSIHHMLLFIDTSTSPTGVKLKFQYITCYSLSALIGLAHPLFHRFNTSHVTLYPRWKLRNNFDVEFQYITCYSLSARRYKTAKGIDVSIHHMLLFIAISGLSPVILSGFNTSHVTLYQVQQMAGQFQNLCFNTSHVTLYLVFTL